VGKILVGCELTLAEAAVFDDGRPLEDYPFDSDDLRGFGVDFHSGRLLNQYCFYAMLGMGLIPKIATTTLTCHMSRLR
jgi:hypothetical protein